MKTRPATTAFHAGLLAAGVTAFAGAQDIGYDALVARLGAANVPTGAGVRVAQVEAPENGTAANHGPDQSLAAFAGKSFSAMSGTPTGLAVSPKPRLSMVVAAEARAQKVMTL